jgi:hypothetical protein
MKSSSRVSNWYLRLHEDLFQVDELSNREIQKQEEATGAYALTRRLHDSRVC